MTAMVQIKSRLEPVTLLIAVDTKLRLLLQYRSFTYSNPSLSQCGHAMSIAVKFELHPPHKVLGSRLHLALHTNEVTIGEPITFS